VQSTCLSAFNKKLLKVGTNSHLFCPVVPCPIQNNINFRTREKQISRRSAMKDGICDGPKKGDLLMWLKEFLTCAVLPSVLAGQDEAR
jgi:hypothetical protein